MAQHNTSHRTNPFRILVSLGFGKLEAEGIPAVIQDEHLVQMNWRYSQAIGSVKVQFPEDGLERARQILAEGQGVESGTTEDSVEEPDEEDICPKCGSSFTFSRPYSLSTFAMSFILFLPFFYRKEGNVCRNCGTVWGIREKEEVSNGF